MNTPTLFDQVAGQAAKDNALASVEEHAGEPLQLVRDYAVRYARKNTTVTIDVVRRWAMYNGIELPQNSWGAVFRGKPLPGHRWLRVGYRPAELVTSHARPVSVWALVAA